MEIVVHPQNVRPLKTEPNSRWAEVCAHFARGTAINHTFPHLLHAFFLSKPPNLKINLLHNFLREFFSSYPLSLWLICQCWKLQFSEITIINARYSKRFFSGSLNFCAVVMIALCGSISLFELKSEALWTARYYSPVKFFFESVELTDKHQLWVWCLK